MLLPREDEGRRPCRLSRRFPLALDASTHLPAQTLRQQHQQVSSRSAAVSRARGATAGDGTILWVSGLYGGPCPPILSFSMGSLGFLTPFDFGDFKQVGGAPS